MILFVADNHYDTHGGRALYECLRNDYDLQFAEDEWACLEAGNLRARYALLVVALIGGTCEVPFPDAAAEEPVRDYVESGGNLLLLHGGSAAFWHWEWWRPLVGYRWVRGDDPDGFPASTHPVRPYRVEVSKSRHPLCGKLKSFDMPEDEIYTNLEQTCPVTTLMETTTDEGTFPMCYETETSHGGRVLGYLPGHRPDAIRTPGNLANVRVLLEELVG
jgi:hypothetical protein